MGWSLSTGVPFRSKINFHANERKMLQFISYLPVEFFSFYTRMILYSPYQQLQHSSSCQLERGKSNSPVVQVVYCLYFTTIYFYGRTKFFVCLPTIWVILYTFWKLYYIIHSWYKRITYLLFRTGSLFKTSFGFICALRGLPWCCCLWLFCMLRESLDIQWPPNTETLPLFYHPIYTSLKRVIKNRVLGPSNQQCHYFCRVVHFSYLYLHSSYNTRFSSCIVHGPFAWSAWIYPHRVTRVVFTAMFLLKESVDLELHA